MDTAADGPLETHLTAQMREELVVLRQRLQALKVLDSSTTTCLLGQEPLGNVCVPTLASVAWQDTAAGRIPEHIDNFLSSSVCAEAVVEAQFCDSVSLQPMSTEDPIVSFEQACLPERLGLIASELNRLAKLVRPNQAYQSRQITCN